MYDIGDKFSTRFGTPFKIVGFDKDKRNKTVYIVEFPCGYRQTCYYHNIKLKKIKYPYDPNIAGIGYLGMATQKNNEKLYHIWRGILRRCYDKRRKDYSRYGGAGVTVSAEWLSFENFLKDIPTLPGWDKEMFDRGKLQLDKDLFSKEKKLYSRETCCFLTAYENNPFVIKKTIDKEGGAA